MTKTDERRALILERLADYVLAKGLSAAGLRPLAAAAQTSDRMLLYYFEDKARIVAATLDIVAARLAGLLTAQRAPAPLPLDSLRVELWTLLRAEALWPYMRLWLEIGSLSARGDPICREVGERIARGFLAWGASQLDSSTPEMHATDAARLLVTIEGMVLLKSVGLDDVCQSAL